MPRRHSPQNADIYDAEIINPTALTPQPVPQLLPARARARSSIGDGGYFDASGSRNPVFNITPRSEDWAVFMVWRVYLSTLRHHAFKTVIGTVAIIYGVTFGSFGLNFLRGDVRRCSGDLWNPAILGCNLAALLVPTSQSLAGDAHDLMWVKRCKPRAHQERTVIRSVRVDGAAL